MRWARSLDLTLSRILTVDRYRTFSQSKLIGKPWRMSKQQPEWLPPANAVEEPILKVYNSLTRTKVKFLATTSNM